MWALQSFLASSGPAIVATVESPDLNVPAGPWTVACSVRRDGGNGPLLESLDGKVALLFEHDGFIASRVDDRVRVTTVPTEALSGRWLALIVTRSESEVEIFVDGARIDSWPAADAVGINGLRVMPDVDGAMRELVVAKAAIHETDIPGLVAYLKSSHGGVYAEYRRGAQPPS
jgi:hypothetical protein